MTAHDHRGLRYINRRSRTSDDGRHAWAFGMRVGYWPCLKGPFVNIEFAIWRIDIWYGLPSFETDPHLTGRVKR